MSNTTTMHAVIRAVEAAPASVRSRRIFRIVPASGNAKTGKCFQVYAARGTCPTSCPFRTHGGCYAENFHCKRVWNSAEGPEAASLDGLAAALIGAGMSTAAPGAFVRHGVAGDFACEGSARLDVQLLHALASIYGAAGVQAVSYTHCAPTAAAYAAVRAAAALGLVVNFSCEHAEQADAALDAHCPAVLEVPADESIPARTPAGRRVVQCPAQTAGRTCAQCRLCARSARSVVVAFVAHGAAHKRAGAAIRAAREAYEAASAAAATAAPSTLTGAA